MSHQWKLKWKLLRAHAQIECIAHKLLLNFRPSSNPALNILLTETHKALLRLKP